MKFFYILFFLTGFLCSLFAGAIEINSDSFVKAESEEMEEETAFELYAPNMEQAYKKEKVIIQRNLSSLDSAVDSAETASSLKSRQDGEEGNEKSANRNPASIPSSLDYGDKEIRWQRP